jgi:hypothetical protein
MEISPWIDSMDHLTMALECLRIMLNGVVVTGRRALGAALGVAVVAVAFTTFPMLSLLHDLPFTF